MSEASLGVTPETMDNEVAAASDSLSEPAIRHTERTGQYMANVMRLMEDGIKASREQLVSDVTKAVLAANLFRAGTPPPEAAEGREAWPRQQVDRVWSHSSASGEEYLVLRLASGQRTPGYEPPGFCKPGPLLAAGELQVSFHR